MCIGLQIHPSLTEQERKRLCRVLDCQRLTLDACMHAAQNERLPLRVVVQVIGAHKLFFLLCLHPTFSNYNLHSCYRLFLFFLTR